MNRQILRIQKGYLLIEKTKDTIKELYETEDIKKDRAQLEVLKEKEEQITNSINGVKDKVFEYEENIQKIEKEISSIIKKLFNNPKSETKKVKDNRAKKEELEIEKEHINKEISKLFVDMDMLKEVLQNHKILYNDMEKKLYQKIAKQNKKIVKYEDKITEMEKKIRKIRRTIDSELLSLYDKKRQKGIIVMAKILDDCCNECGEKLSKDIIDTASKKEIVECPKCGRILYIADTDEESLD